MGVKTTEKELLDVFVKYISLLTKFSWVNLRNTRLTVFSVFSQYGFAVESYTINAKLPKLQLVNDFMKRIIKFQDDFDSQGALTIYVYCDRGVLDDANNKAYMIA